MHKPLWCAAVALLCLLVAACATSARAAEPRLRGEPASEPRTFRKEIRQVMGSALSQQDARSVAIAQAKRDALEQAGTYLESFSVVRNASLERDDVLALSAGVLKAEIVQEQPFLEAGVFGIVVVAQVQVDPSILDERIVKLLADRQGLAQLKAADKRQQELLAKIAALEAENARLKSGSATPAQTQALQAAFKDSATRLTAQDWFAKGLALWNGKGFTPAQLAVEYFSQAIALDPGFALAYNNRGEAYRNLKQYERAIADYEQALRLDPNYAVAYNNRGAAYDDLKQYERAIADYEQALRLDPMLAAAYNNRGLAYAGLKQYERAIADYDRALRLDPKLAVAYYNRGLAYADLGNLARAYQDLRSACALGQQPACELLAKYPEP